MLRVLLRGVGFLSLGRQSCWINNVSLNLGLNQGKKEVCFFMHLHAFLPAPLYFEKY